MSLSINPDPFTQDNRRPCREQFNIVSFLVHVAAQKTVCVTKLANVTSGPTRIPLMFTSHPVTSKSFFSP